MLRRLGEDGKRRCCGDANKNAFRSRLATCRKSVRLELHLKASKDADIVRDSRHKRRKGADADGLNARRGIYFEYLNVDQA